MKPSELCQLSLTQNEGAERRQALGCSGTRRRTNRGPHALSRLASRANRSRSPRAGDAPPLGAPPRRFFGSRPALARPLSVANGAVLAGLALVHSHVPLVVAEGQCRPDASRGMLFAWTDPQDAASRSAIAMPRESTSSERDAAKMAAKNGSSSFGRARLSMGCRWIRAFQRRAREKCSSRRALGGAISMNRNLRGCSSNNAGIGNE
jgi:hypothetical protein